MCRRTVENGAWFLPLVLFMPQSRKPFLLSCGFPFSREWTELQLCSRCVCLRFAQLPTTFLNFLVYLWLQLFQSPRSQKLHIFSLPNSHPPLMLSQHDTERGRWIYWGFFMDVFLCHFIKVLLVSNKPTFLRPPLWYWILQTTFLPARAVNRGPWRHCKEEGTFPSSPD